MAITTAKQAVHLRDLTRTFDEAVLTATPDYPKFCTVIPSEGAEEKYGFLGSMPGVREWLGERKFKELLAADYELPNKHWESSLTIPRNDLKDGRALKYGPVMQDLAAEATYHPDELLFSVIQAGESSVCWDGQYFFDTDHAWGDSGSQSNDITSTVSSTSAVTAAEMKTAISAAATKMLSFKKDNGKFVHRPTLSRTLSGLTVLVPPALRIQAYEALEAQLIGGGNSNFVIDKPEVVVSPYLSSSVKFYLLKTDVAVKPFVFQAREPLRRQMKYVGDTDIEFKDAKFMTEARYNVGYGMWANAVLVTLTT